MSKISIIMPVYNSEKYLARALDSICVQTYKKLEIICVNDASTDNSLEILEQYAEKDSRIKIISYQENRGQGYARNLALENASGEYIGFMDSDDTVDATYFEYLMNKMLASNADIVSARVVILDSDDKISAASWLKNIEPLPTEISSLNDRLTFIYDRLNVCPYKHLYKKELLKYNNIKFFEGKLHEDQFFVASAFYHADKIILESNSSPVYYYCQNIGSSMNDLENVEKYKKIVFDQLDIIEQIILYFTNLKLYNDYFEIIYADFLKIIYDRSNNIMPQFRDEYISKADDIFKGNKKYSALLKKEIQKNNKNYFIKKICRKEILGKRLLSREISPSLCKYKILGITIYKSEIKDYYQCRHFFGIRLYKKFRYQDFVSAQSAQLQSKIHEQSTQLQSKMQEQSAQLISKMQEQSAQLESKMRTIVAEESSRALSVYSLHQKVFPKYKNIHQGQDIVVVATGPSLNDYVPIEGAIHIGVNRAFLHENINLDYCFILDYPNVKPYISALNEYKSGECKKFYGIFKNPYDTLQVPHSEALAANAERFYLNYNNFEYNDDFPLDISTHALASFWTTTFQAIQFALWTNPKKLYLVGCDESDMGHFNGDKQFFVTKYSDDIKERHKIIHDDGWKKLKNFVSLYYPKMDVISINPVGLKGLFKDVYISNIDVHK